MQTIHALKVEAVFNCILANCGNCAGEWTNFDAACEFAQSRANEESIDDAQYSEGVEMARNYLLTHQSEFARNLGL